MTKARDIADGVDTADIADGAISTAKLADNSINATKLDVSGNGTAGQLLKSDGDGTFTWIDSPEPFQATTVSGTTHTLDLSSANYFNGGTTTGNTTLAFSNVPTAKTWSYDITMGGTNTYYAYDQMSSVEQTGNAGGGSNAISSNLYPLINSDGTKLLAVANNSSGNFLLKEYSLSTAYDLSSGFSYDDEHVGASAGFSIRGAFAKPDDLKFFGLAYWSSSLLVFSYDFSADFDISTKSNYTSNTLASSLADTHKSLTFSHDGTKMFICDSTTTVKGWTLSTAWDISTVSRASSLDSGSLGIISRGMQFNSDGTVGAIFTSDSVKIYNLSTAYDWSTATLDTTVSKPGITTSDDGLCVSSDGSYVFIGSGTFSISRRSIGGFFAHTLTYPASVQNPTDIISTMEYQDKYKLEFITTDGGTTVWKTGHNKYQDN